MITLEGLKAKIARVVIADLRENTFFASVIVERDARGAVDRRAPVGLDRAGAARQGADLREREAAPAAAPVEDDGARGGREPRPLTDEEKAEQLRRYLEKLNPEDFGKFQI